MLLVGHREGIRDLCDCAGWPHRKTAYCCVTKLIFDRDRAQQVADAGLLRAPGDGVWDLIMPPTTHDIC